MGKSGNIRIIQIDEIRWHNVGAWYAVSLSRGMAELGHEVFFIGKDDLPPVVMAREAGLTVRNDFKFNALRFISESRKLANIAKEFQADVICAHRAWGMNMALAARAMLPKPGPVMVRTRVDARAVKAGLGNRFLYRDMVDGVVVTDGRSLFRYKQDLGMLPERIRLLPGGVNTEAFKPDESARKIREEWGVPPDAPLIGLVARIDYVKGHRHFLEAASEVTKKIPTAYFAIIGEEVNVKISDLKRMANELRIFDRVIFIGFRQDIPRCVAALDIGVISSTGSEALSRVALEYMACALPVVATTVGGIPDIVEDGTVGYMVPPGDSGKMAEAIIKLIEQPDMAKRMGQEGRNRAVNIYSRKEVARETINFYLELIERRVKKSR